MSREAIVAIVEDAREKLNESGVKVREGRGKKRLQATLPSNELIMNLPTVKESPALAAVGARAAAPIVEKARRDYALAKLRADYAFGQMSAKERRAKAIAILRGVESATAGRNVARAEEGRKVKAAREASVASRSSTASVSPNSSASSSAPVSSNKYAASLAAILPHEVAQAEAAAKPIQPRPYENVSSKMTVSEVIKNQLYQHARSFDEKILEGVRNGKKVRKQVYTLNFKNAKWNLFKKAVARLLNDKSHTDTILGVLTFFSSSDGRKQEFIGLRITDSTYMIEAFDQPASVTPNDILDKSIDVLMRTKVANEVLGT
jgi:hypothetical protein